MKPLLVLLGCALLLGCRRNRKEPSPVAAPAAETTVATESAAVPSLPSTIPAEPVRPAGPHPGEPLNPKDVRAAYHKYFERVGNFPNNWPDMIRQKMIPAVPQGKNGQPLDFVQFTLWEAGRPPK